MKERKLIEREDYLGYPEKFWDFAVDKRIERHQKEQDDAIKKGGLLFDGEYWGPSYYEDELQDYVEEYEKSHDVKLRAN